eukprot:TRINITY_DN4089_c0_g1_i2.p1 TRINITY_DN4089_c0_g1~~TRINITY_DN4089_c0_g1_i2.p1  ORF type:complete len:182 (+),score=39.17 TRINITY_DN4089_c0_g1_i2:124-669(+)
MKAAKPVAHKHPKYEAMVKEALKSLNERTGSSSQAIAKYLSSKKEWDLPSNFGKNLSLQLKRLVADGKLKKIKASYKLDGPAKTAVAKKKTVVKKKAVVKAKVKKASEKPAVKAVKKVAAKTAKKPAAKKVVVKKPAKKSRQKDNQTRSQENRCKESLKRDRKSTRLNSSHEIPSRMPSSA